MTLLKLIILLNLIFSALHYYEILYYDFYSFLLLFLIFFMLNVKNN